jgi:hypothetical protein
MDEQRGFIIIGAFGVCVEAVYEEDYTLDSIREKCQRLLIGDSMTYRLDVTKMSPFPWSLFLKVLESPFLIGKVEFFGAPLSFYPETIRSRCKAFYGQPVVLGDYIKEHKLESVAYVLTGLRDSLPNETLDALADIARTHDSVIDFLTVLDSAKTGDYPIIYTYAKEMNNNHYRMFYAWYFRSYFMSDEEKNLCSFLGKQSNVFSARIYIRGEQGVLYYFLQLFLLKVLSK